ncbi:MAG: TolC family protein [Cyclobacteriaceae bacterium]|nr:TolC family protein [Cyclobacteriaceae bacterium]
MRLLIFILLLPFVTKAQTLDYNKVIVPEHIATQVFEEKLVQLAWKNNPSNEILLQNIKIAEREKRVSGLGWLSEIYASGNLNEFTIDPNRETDNVFFPRYNFGIRVSLGTFFITPQQVKIANDRINNAKSAVGEQKLSVRETVLSNVEKFKQYYKFIKLREQIREDYFTLYKDSERRFSLGEVSMEIYRNSVQAYYKQVELVIEAQTNFNSSKLLLESLVGVPLQEIDGYQGFLQKLDAELRAY